MAKAPSEQFADFSRQVSALNDSVQDALESVQEQLNTLTDAVQRLETGLAAVAERAVQWTAPTPTPKSPAAKRGPEPARDRQDGCQVPHCEAGVLAKQLCETHYRIMRRAIAAGEEFDPAKQRPARARVASRACQEDDCSEPHYAKGLCRRHYMATRSRIRTAERQGATTSAPESEHAPPPAAADEDAIHPHSPTPPSNGGTGSLATPIFRLAGAAASTSSSREALPTAEVVSRVVTQYRGGLDRVAEVLGRNKRTLMELLDRLDLMPFVTRIREAERQRVESATLRERLDDLLFREKLLDDLGCLKDVDERARFEVKMRCAELAKSSETIEEVLQRLGRDLNLDDAGMKRLIWRYDLRRHLRGLKLKPEAAPARSR